MPSTGRHVMRARPAIALLTAALALCPVVAASAADNEPSKDVAVSNVFLRDSSLDQSFPLGVGVAVAFRSGPISLLAELSHSRTTIENGASTVSRGVTGVMGGARLSGRGRTMAFLQLLTGIVRVTDELSTLAANNAALQIGGGGDIALGAIVGLRLQANYRVVLGLGGVHSEPGGAVGLVFFLGER